jgi:hypothetical protein
MTAGSIQHRQGYLELDCGRSDPRELSDLYRALAVECVQRQTRRALVKALDCEADGHHALRDALTTMILAGIPAQFKLALLTNGLRLQALFRELQVDLRRLKVDAEVFGDEERALAWLRGMSEPAARERGALRPPG